MRNKTNMDNLIFEAEQISESASEDVFFDDFDLFGEMDPLAYLNDFDDAEAVSYPENGKAFAMVRELLQKKGSETWEADQARVFDEIMDMYARKAICFDELTNCIFALRIAEGVKKFGLKSA
ncbi:MAG: hypothetical protein J5736_04510 [Bacilli bacterium]|nr:hypothetical protein [Bacilli bacterium]